MGRGEGGCSGGKRAPDVNLAAAQQFCCRRATPSPEIKYSHSPSDQRGISLLSPLQQKRTPNTNSGNIMYFRPRAQRLLMRFRPGKDPVFVCGFCCCFVFVFFSFDLVTALLRFHFAKTPEAGDACNKDATMQVPGEFTYYILLRISVTLLPFSSPSDQSSSTSTMPL